MTPQLAADACLRDALPTTDSTTLPTYTMQQPSGSPLQAGATDATLELVVSNDGFQIVTCAKIVVRPPVGPNAADLTADATGI